MQIPSEFFETKLNPVEFKTAVALYSLASESLLIETTTEVLAELTGYSLESLRRAFRGLEDKGILETTRTKRNFGKWSKNKYQLVLPSHKSVGSEPSHKSVGSEPPHKTVGWPDSPSHKSVGSTGEHVVPGGYVASNSYKDKTTNKRNTSYFFVRTHGAHMGKEIVVPKWTPEEDDNLAGFGLFEEEVAQKEEQKKPKVSKRDPWTRNQRPVEEWTPADVAAEFSHQVWLRNQDAVPMVNRQRLAGALRGYRSKYGTSAALEVELIKMFFENERNFRKAMQDPHRLIGWYLNSFKNGLPEARARLGVAPSDIVVDSEFTDSQPIEVGESIAERKFRERIEQKQRALKDGQV